MSCTSNANWIKAIVLHVKLCQNDGDAFEQAGVDVGLGIHLIQMVRRAGNLRRQPNGAPPLLFQFCLDAFPDMYLLDFLHKNSVELIPCLNIRVSTPHISNKLFHAVTIRHS